MTINHHMIEDRLETEQDQFLFTGYVEASADEPKITACYELRSVERKELELEIHFLAENPIGIDEIVIGGATYYGFCIASKTTRQTAKEAIRCYRESRREKPDRSIVEHAQSAAACLAAKGNVIRDTVADALIDCLGLSDDGQDDNNEDSNQ